MYLRAQMEDFYGWGGGDKNASLHLKKIDFGAIVLCYVEWFFFNIAQFEITLIVK